MTNRMTHGAEGVSRRRIHPQLKTTHRGRLARREPRTRAVEVRCLDTVDDATGHTHNNRSETH